jgi:hypothetical protein
MTDAELIEALARALDRCRTLARAEKARPHEFVAGHRTALEAIPHVVAEALSLLDAPRNDLLEEVALVFRALENDVVIARGTGTPAVISSWTWERAVPVMRRLGLSVDD